MINHIFSKIFSKFLPMSKIQILALGPHPAAISRTLSCSLSRTPDKEACQAWRHWRHCQPRKAIETCKICASLSPFLSVETIKNQSFQITLEDLVGKLFHSRSNIIFEICYNNSFFFFSWSDSSEIVQLFCDNYFKLLLNVYQVTLILSSFPLSAVRGQFFKVDCFSSKRKHVCLRDKIFFIRTYKITVV